MLAISFPFSGKARLVDKCSILNIKACAVGLPIICALTFDQAEEIYAAWQLPLFHKD